MEGKPWGTKKQRGETQLIESRFFYSFIFTSFVCTLATYSLSLHVTICVLKSTILQICDSILICMQEATFSFSLFP